MPVVSRPSRKKSWQTGRERVSVLAALAIHKETVSRRLTELREEHELTQEKAAARVGVTMRQWQRWETGKSVPYPRNLEAIAYAFEINVAEFFEDGRVVSDADARSSPADRLARIEAKLDAIEGERHEHADLIEDMLARQTEILSRIEALVLALPADEVTERLRRVQAGADQPRTQDQPGGEGAARARRTRRRAEG